MNHIAKIQILFKCTATVLWHLFIIKNKQFNYDCDCAKLFSQLKDCERNIEIDFSDTKTSITADNLYSYAIIAQGKDVTGASSVLNIQPNKYYNIFF